MIYNLEHSADHRDLGSGLTIDQRVLDNEALRPHGFWTTFREKRSGIVMSRWSGYTRLLSAVADCWQERSLVEGAKACHPISSLAARRALHRTHNACA
jgi:hypothetical protein